MRRKVLITCLLSALVILVAAFAVVLLENQRLRDAFLPYAQVQSIAGYEDEPIEASFIFIDSVGLLDSLDPYSDTVTLVSPEGDQLEAASFEVELLKETNWFSPYQLFEVRVGVVLAPSTSIGVFSHLQIKGSSYDIGLLTIQTCEKVVYPNIGTGASPFYDDHQL
ncbi:MAG: hypothetical protein FWD55_08075, partial [Propionibacteriaceae bacterium]|nr:hypothetical protein [Propionibacteriaceae bacterium]